MGKISLVMFDLYGTTAHDGTGVCDCLYKAALEYNLHISPEEILIYMGTNKIYLNRFLFARSQGKHLTIEGFEKKIDPGTYDQAVSIFNRYTEIMIEHYRRNVKEVDGASETFRWCHQNGIKVATDTEFHRNVTNAIMEGLGWLRDGLVDIAVSVDDIPGEIGRPEPFMFYHAMMQLNIQNVNEVKHTPMMGISAWMTCSMNCFSLMR